MEPDDGFASQEMDGKRLLAAIEAEAGPDAPEAIEVSDLLVQILMRISKKRVPEAVAFGERALASAERIYEPEDLRLLKPLHILSDALGYLGSVPEVDVVLERALAIHEKALGPDHPSLTESLGRLATSKRALGDYAAARLLRERNLAILEKAKGKDDPSVGFALSDLAASSRSEGDLENALMLAERSVRIIERAPFPEKNMLPMMIATQAEVLYEMRRFAEARDAWERAIGFWTQYLINLAWGLSAQALALSGLGEHDRAVAQAQRALEIQTSQVDPDDRTLVLFLRNLATVLTEAGEDARARPLLERALRLRVFTFGPDHPSVAPLLDSLSRVEYRLGMPVESLEHALRGESIARQEFLRTARILSERQAYRYETSRASSLQVILSLLTRERTGTAQVEWVWDELVRSRALVLDELTSRHNAALMDESPEVARLARELRMVKSRLASLVLGSDETFGDAVARAQARKESIERELTRSSSEYRRLLAQENVGLDSIRSALPEDAALLSYVEYSMIPVVQGGAQQKADRPPERHYGAFLLAASPPQARFYPLGPAREIEPLVLAWRESAGKTPEGLEPAGGPSPQESYEKTGRLLRERIWDPMSPAIRGSRKLFIVPDGALHLVNLATLPTEEGKYLVETGPLLHHLSAERDLVRQSGRRYTSSRALLVGGPDPDAAPVTLAADASSDGVLPLASDPVVARQVFRSASPTCDEFRTLRFAPLPAARKEVSDMLSLLEGRMEAVELSGPQATEAAFKAMAPGYRILHIATHGFFLTGRCPSALGTARAGSVEDNPLLLSGLALAGANRRGEQRGPAEIEDGILTAEEVGSLDLTTVEWAVLSACETGIGRVEAGEGVLGLRRAFAVAGAGTLIMSLWRVEDDATRAWMGRLYRARLSGLSTAESVREASLSLIRERRDKGRSTHPFFWGGFVAEGDWR